MSKYHESDFEEAEIAWGSIPAGAGLPAFSAVSNVADAAVPESWPESWPKPWSESRSESWSESWSESFPPTVENKVLVLLAVSPKGTKELLPLLHLATLANSLRTALASLLSRGLVERTIPDKPTSRLQQYRLTAKGCAAIDAATAHSGKRSAK